MRREFSFNYFSLLYRVIHSPFPRVDDGMGAAATTDSFYCISLTSFNRLLPYAVHLLGSDGVQVARGKGGGDICLTFLAIFFNIHKFLFFVVIILLGEEKYTLVVSFKEFLTAFDVGRVCIVCRGMHSEGAQLVLDILRTINVLLIRLLCAS